MFLLKALAALGLAQAAFAESCCNDKCGKPVGLARYGRRDCSSILVTYITPTRTTTVYRDTTKTVASTVVRKVTDTKDITVTTIFSLTKQSVSTDLATVTETDVETNISIDTETAFSTVTVPYSVSVVAPPKKRSNYYNTPPRPAYANACNSYQYTRACSCLGVKPRTITLPAVVKTVTKTRSATKTNVVTVTSHAATKTLTDTLSQTVYTTVVSGTTVTATEVVTVTTELEATVTTVVVATQTAGPQPPLCTGTGFYLQTSSQTYPGANGFLGFINSIGQGIYLRVFSGGGSPLTVDGNGNIVSYYSPTDIKMLVLDSGPPPYQLWFSSDQANVHYNVKNDPVSCQLGSAPDFPISCKGPDGSAYSFALCLDPVYFEWDAWIYQQGNEASLAGKTCVLSNAGGINAVCR
ncbi:hypothetical protein H072_7162 [Dactylellina haptotyla CBS 200.50]|uniref:Uncharacterized protein n=1 Tax=Dactylellina haptotyla (strain CBS 200.50) TaxID=1284197 RepID=S8BID1_DACHA|nr:hypothetical protein H072_7162 [Dactylellina haptotyla CBS 200.50]